MKKLIFITFALLFMISCDLGFEEDEQYWEAEIVSYNFDCDIFILQINEDSTLVADSLGESNNLEYHVVNMDTSEFAIGDKLMLKLRKATPIETPACKSMGPYLNYPFVYLLDYEPINNFEYSDTIQIEKGASVTDYNLGYKITFDRVTADSRCNVDSCSWLGVAYAQFTIDFNGDSTNVINIRLGNYARLRNNYFQFIDLYPYPYLARRLILMNTLYSFQFQINEKARRIFPRAFVSKNCCYVKLILKTFKLKLRYSIQMHEYLLLYCVCQFYVQPQEFVHFFVFHH